MDILRYALIVFALTLVLSEYKMDKVLGIALIAAIIYYAIT